MEITLKKTVGEIVKSNFRTASLFQANRIDYCCGGGKTLAAVCEETGIEPENLINELKSLALIEDPDTAYINSMKPDQLAEYIVTRHHSYVKKMIPFLTASLDKICGKHGENHPELFRIRDLFNTTAGNLSMHMQKEELMLFPFIHKMVISQEHQGNLPLSIFGSVSNPIRSMLNEHTDEGERLDEIARLSGDYNPPADGCTTYRITYQHLKEFEADLHRHIHLENNVLFPKAEQLEEELKKH
jgi:regulator of cell morphogenesis and NO signaling